MSRPRAALVTLAICAALGGAALLTGPGKPHAHLWLTPGHRALTACVSSDCGSWSVTLNWSVPTVAGQTGYNLLSCQGASCTPSQFGTASASPFTFTGLDCGASYTLEVQAHNSGGTGIGTAWPTSYSSPACPPGPGELTEPVVSGTVATGDVLSTTNGTWSGSPTGYTYQWQDCATDGTSCSNITGATSSTYTVASGDSGHTIEALVTATNSNGSTQAGAPIVPLVDNFPNSSVDTNVWDVINQVANTGDDEPVCFLPSQVTEGSNQMVETYGYSSGGNTCPPAAGSGDPITTLNGSLTNGVAVTSIPINAVNSAYSPIAGTLTVSDGTNTDTFTATGPPSGGSIPVSSHAPSHSYSSGATVNPTLSQDFISGTVEEQSTAFTYGTIKVSAEFPANPRTTWPAIWLFGAACQVPNYLSSNCSWPSDTSDAAEIDVAEGVTGNQTSVKENVYSNSLSNPCTSGTISNYATNFHTYEVDWSPGSLVFKIDGVTQTGCDVSSANVPSHPMFLIIDSTVENSGSETQADLPAAMTVAYVHVSH